MTKAEFDLFLETISTCFINRDFETWAALIRLPFTMVTKDGPVVMSNLSDLRVNFEHYLAAMDIMQLDTVMRQAIALEDCEDGTVIGTYRTELLSRGKRATDPYTSSALLHPSDTGWRMSAIMNARGHHEWTGHAPLKKRD